MLVLSNVGLNYELGVKIPEIFVKISVGAIAYLGYNAPSPLSAKILCSLTPSYAVLNIVSSFYMVEDLYDPFLQLK